MIFNVYFKPQKNNDVIGALSLPLKNRYVLVQFLQKENGIELYSEEESITVNFYKNAKILGYNVMIIKTNGWIDVRISL